MTYRYWDCNVFLAWLKEEPDKVAQCQAGLREAEAGNLVIVTSALTLAEALYLVRGELPVSVDTREKVRGSFRSKYIVLQELDRRTAERAQDMVWDHGLDHKDAIHVATALVLGEQLAIEQLDTYDSGLQGRSGQIDGLVIGEPNFQIDLMSDAAAAAQGGD